MVQSYTDAVHDFDLMFCHQFLCANVVIQVEVVKCYIRGRPTISSAFERHHTCIAVEPDFFQKTIQGLRYFVVCRLILADVDMVAGDCGQRYDEVVVITCTVQNCCKDNKNNPFEQVSIVKSAEMCLFCLRLSRFEVNIGRRDRG